MNMRANAILVTMLLVGFVALIVGPMIAATILKASLNVTETIERVNDTRQRF